MNNALEYVDKIKSLWKIAAPNYSKAVEIKTETLLILEENEQKGWKKS